MSRHTLYAGNPSWTVYRDLLASRFGIAIAREPEERWQDWRGHRIHLDDWRPQAAPKGTLILVHGGGGHGRLLAPLGDAATALGWRAIAPDLPGYGLTQVARGWRWDYAEWPALVADLAGAAAADGPVVLMGLSVGGLTALYAAQREPRVRHVIATTLIDLADRGTFVRAARWPWLGWLSLGGFALTPWVADRLPLPLALATPIGTLTSDPELRRFFERDPLLGRKVVPGRFFRSIHRYRSPRGDYALPCPILLVHPGADAWTPTAMSMPVFDAIPTPKRFRELTNGSHLPAESPAYAELRGEIEAVLAAVLQEPVA